jgi:hypothetical protein
MANYGLKYTGSFDSSNQNSVITYLVEIFKKEYEGDVTTLLLAANPVIHTWENDEFDSVIKGSSVQINYINTGSLPLESFYSEEDDTFKIVVSCVQNSQTLFIGYLVQDDCIEDLVDYNHEVTLSANDNLGLLKEITLDRALIPDWGGYPALLRSEYDPYTPVTYLFIMNTKYVPEVGDYIIITKHYNAYVNTTVSVTAVERIGNGNFKVTIAETVFTSGYYSCKLDVNGTGTDYFDLLKRNSLLDIIQLCLFNNTIQLPLYILARFSENNQEKTRTFLEQTYIDSQTFLDGDNYKSCWDILEIICKTFQLTLFQANGSYYLVKYNDFQNSTSAFYYDADFNFINEVGINDIFNIGYNQETFPENAPNKALLRPIKYARETFNYNQPRYLIFNSDFQILGDLITTYTSGVYTINEYEAPGFYNWIFAPFPSIFIRVTIDALGNEVGRVLVIKGSTGDNSRSCMCEAFDIGQNDNINISFTIQTNKSQSGSITLNFSLGLFNGTSYNYADDATLTWTNVGPDWAVYWSPSENTNQQKNITMNPRSVPYDGQIRLFFPQLCFGATPTDETIISDISIQYTSYINESTKIIGQIHDNSQNKIIKNNYNEIITLDDSPRNPILGTLFINDFLNDFLQIRTISWERFGNTEALRIGEIITESRLLLNGVPKKKIEGTFHNVFQNPGNVTLACLFDYYQFINDRFVPGRLEIDYRNDSFSATLYELFNTEIVPIIDNTYNFSYLYDTK